MRAIRRPTLTFRFDGGDAAEGQLNFYDSGRFQYGAARFVYTLEHFRQTGRVLSRINTKVDAEYRVSTPSRGSFILEVIQVAAPILAETAIKVPIQILMAQVMERLTPGRKSRELAAEVLKDAPSLDSERTALERERTAQERERTEQLRLLTQTNSQALDLVSRALDRSSASDPKTQVLTEIK